MPPPASDYLSATQVAKRLYFSRPTVVSWITKGLLKGTRNPGSRHYRIKKQDAAAFCRQHGYDVPLGWL